MWHKLFIVVFLLSATGIATSKLHAAQSPHVQSQIFVGYYSREGNNEKMAQTTGKNHYIKFYPGDRIIRLYIPYPYAKSVTPQQINQAFETAAKYKARSAYIRDKLGVMSEIVMVHLDTYRWIDGQLMYDCGKAQPCRVEFEKDSMTVIKPGMVLEHKIRYENINQ